MFSVLKKLEIRPTEKSASKIPKVRGGIRGFWKKLIFEPHFFRGSLPLDAVHLPHRLLFLLLHPPLSHPSSAPPSPTSLPPLPPSPPWWKVAAGMWQVSQVSDAMYEPAHLPWQYCSSVN